MCWAECIVNTPEIPAGAAGICATCIQPHEGCSDGGWGCCDSRDACVRGECCIDEGLNCAPGAGEYCAGFECGTNTECVKCPRPGDAPNTFVGCCTLETRGPVCAVPCTETLGGPCAPPGCRTNPGHWTCTVTGDVCEPTLSSEVCDGIDNDCSGGVDNIVSTPCHGPVPPSTDLDPDSGLPRFAGCPGFDLAGTTGCQTVDGEPREICHIVEGFCAWDTTGNPIDGSGDGRCFTGRGGPCEVTGCFAGEWCCSPHPDGGFNECTPVGEQNDPGNPPIILYSRPTECWVPGQLSEVACPAPSDCSRHDLCSECASDSHCGWCGPYGRCLPGTNSGPAADIGCGVLNAPDGWIRDATLDYCS